jgi:Beta-lactamase.
VELVPGRPQHLAPGPEARFLRALAAPDSLTQRAFAYPQAPRGYGHSEAFQRAVLPAMNLHGTAQGLAKAYALVLETHLGLGPELWERALAPMSQGFDPVLQRETAFGLGFMRPTAETPLGLGASSFGHPGAGGTLAFADLDHGLTFALVVNRQVPGAVAASPLGQSLVQTLRDCL